MVELIVEVQKPGMRTLKGRHGTLCKLTFTSGTHMGIAPGQ